VSKPGNSRRRAGVQTDHGAATGIGTPGERARYVTHEEQLRALVAHMRRRDRRLSRAVVKVFSADARLLGAFGAVLTFVAEQSRRDARGDGGARRRAWTPT